MTTVDSNLALVNTQQKSIYPCNKGANHLNNVSMGPVIYEKNSWRSLVTVLHTVSQ